MRDLKVDGAGGVVQPHEITKSIAGALPENDITVRVLEITNENPDHAPKYSANWEVKCEYPDGFIASHQVSKDGDFEELLAMVRRQLRGRHGEAHGKAPVKGVHGLNHVAGDLVSVVPEDFSELAGMALVFEKI